MILHSILRARPAHTQLRGRLLPLNNSATLRLIRANMSTSATPPKLTNVAINTEPGIAILKYNRPKSGNALNTPTIKEILAGLQWAESSSDVRVVITTGEGKLYTAGLDLLDPANQGPDSTISDEFIDVLR